MRSSLLVSALAVALASASPAVAQELSLGSEPDRTLEAHGIFFLAGLKSRNHFGFNSDGFRKGEPQLGRDLGFSSFLPGFGLDATVNLGALGWVGGEVIGLGEEGNVARLDRLRRVGPTTLREGDIVESSATVFWGGIEYGYEVRVRLFEWLDLACSPTFGLNVLDFDADLRRLLPDPTGDLGGHVTAVLFAPGLRVRFEAFGVVRLGLEGETGLTHRSLSLTKNYTTLWEHYRAFVGLNVMGVDVTVGWRLDAMHASGGGDYVDLRLDGLYLMAGARF